MGIVTKTGDKGETGLASGERVSKACPRMEACGTADELASALGLARSLIDNNELGNHIKKVQGDLLSLGTELATTKGKGLITETHVKYTEDLVNTYKSKLKALTGFVLPGDSTPSAALDVARTVCRRLERKMVALKDAGEFKNDSALKYINRLSDILFIFARCV